ncbi:uncharacterized protein JCM15063_001843 [Sporobolomyces koalae]|uniref:uncharacterized protein n=1 Tax=Sporobolomyces koalae TaxID=500713 RepID=UPI003177535C
MIDTHLANERHPRIAQKQVQALQDQVSASEITAATHPTPVAAPVDWEAVARVFAAAISSSPFNTAVTSSGVYMQEPIETFDGFRPKDKEDARKFVAQVATYIRDTAGWTDEGHKVSYGKKGVYTSYLREQAYRFAFSYLALSQAGLERPVHAWLRNFDAYKAKLSTPSSNSDQSASNARKLYLLRQTGAASSYAAEFRRISLSSNWEPNALKFCFIQGLKEEIKDALARLDEIEGFEKLVDRVVTIDNRLYHRRLERRLERNGNTRASSATYHFAPPVTTNAAGSRARGSLTPTEKQYRQDNHLCGYCGSPDHEANDYDCPHLKAKNARSFPAMPPSKSPRAQHHRGRN